MAAPGLNRRWWIPLVIVGLLILALAGWVAVQAHDAAQQQDVVRAIEQVGGRADTRPDWSPIVYWLPNAVCRRLPNKFLRFDYVERVDLCGKKGIDPLLERLPTLGWLTTLSLSGSDVSDHGMKCLRSLRRLEELQLSSTQITDAGLEPIEGLPRLHGLTLCWTAITDDGLRHVATLRALERLELDKTKVTDAGLEHLKGLSNLQFVVVTGTAVTAEGAKRLKRALSKCTVRR